MHYILLSIALNLGKENINYMKVGDIKGSTKSVEQSINSNNQAMPVELPKSDSDMEQLFFEDEDSFDVPYIGNDNFAELLPEEEVKNVVDNEEQGPKFIESIKNKLLKITEKKDSEVVVGSQVEGPKFFDSIKNKLLGDKKGTGLTQVDNEAIIIDESAGPSFADNLENKPIIPSTASNNSSSAISSQVKEPSLIPQVREDSEGAAQKITQSAEVVPNKAVNSTVASNASSKTSIKRGGSDSSAGFEKVKIVGTLFDSELDNALKDDRALQYKNVLNKGLDLDANEIVYNEDEDYKKFLAEKEDVELVKPEKILAPGIIPRKKEPFSYQNKDIPEELMASRSFQNRHIPPIMQNKDRQAILEKVIEYGMMPEFRAFMNDFRDSNMVMANQYTLLTYATKYKQYDMMRYLIHIGADVNKRDDRFDTPLSVAVQNNDISAVRVLIEANANPDMPDILKRTPLMYCIEKNQEPIGVYLIENGANINTTNAIGEGTLAMSMRFGRNAIKEKILEVLRKKEQ